MMYRVSSSPFFRSLGVSLLIYCSIRLNSPYIYCPPNGVPNIPTASSAQMSRRTMRSTPHKTMRWLVFFTFLRTNSHIRPVPTSRIPATTKSDISQCTSSVNCMATSGISNIIEAINKIMTSLLFFIIINIGRLIFFRFFIFQCLFRRHIGYLLPK